MPYKVGNKPANAMRSMARPASIVIQELKSILTNGGDVVLLDAPT